MNLRKILENKIAFFFLFVITLLFNSCKNQTKLQTPFSNNLARVEDVFLTEEYAKIFLDTIDQSSSEYKIFIKEWIENQIILKECEKRKILNSKEYLRAIENSKYSIARALLFQKILSEINFETPEYEVKNFYEKYKEDFILSFDAYIYNYALFENKEDAVFFRNLLFENDWSNAVSLIQRKEINLVENKTDLFSKEFEIYPTKILLALKLLNLGETSIALNIENKYAIVQLIAKYSKGDTLSYNVAKEIAKERYKILKANNYIREFLTNIYKNYKIEAN